MGLDIPDTKADPGTIRAAAGRLEAVATRMMGHGEQAGGAVDRAAPSFSDLVAPRIRARGKRAVAAVQCAVQHTVYGAGITDQWADDVAWFKAERQKLLAAFDDFAAQRYGVAKPDPETKPSEYTAAIDRARARAEGRYNAQGAALYNQFKQRARERGTELTKKATADRLRELDAAGNLPLSAYLIYDKFGVQWARPHALISRLIDAGVLPKGFASMSFWEGMRYLEQHPEIAQKLVGQRALVNSADPAERALALALLAGAGLSMHAPGVTGMQAIRNAFNKMSPETRRWLAMLLPGVIGNLAGAPFESRATANRVRIIAEVPRANGELQRLLRELDEKRRLLASYPRGSDRIEDQIDRLSDRIKELRGQLRVYDSVLKEHRWFVYFDPRGDGKWAELVNPIGHQTRDVTLYVPGTNSSLGGANSIYQTARGFADESGGKLSVLVWGGGDFPNGFGNAAHPDYAQNMAPHLAAFSHELRFEIRQSAAAGGHGVNVTALGHSYGGAVVGLAERHGLDANRILHVESAGAGYGINDVDQYRNANGNVPRYAMTAPGDPIGYVQGQSLFGLGHGSDVDSMAGVKRLTTGNYPDGTPISGPQAHGGVLTRHSDAWWNMYNVMTGGEVQLRPEPPPSTGYPAKPAGPPAPARTEDVP
jgi:hypothetical protein